MKSHKILRLEFVSDKIEGGDRKKKVMYIHFGHPTKKNELVWGSPWEAAMAGVAASMGAHGELTEEGKEGEGEEEAGAWLGALGRLGCHGVGRRAYSLAATTALCSLATIAAHMRRNLHVRKKGRRKERRKRKGRKSKERKKEKIWKIFQTLKFSGRKIKDNLWSW
jgi:hypothetical protein